MFIFVFYVVSFVFSVLAMPFVLTHLADSLDWFTKQRSHCINIWEPLDKLTITIVMPAKCDSDGMFCLQSYQGLRLYRSLVYYL